MDGLPSEVVEESAWRFRIGIVGASDLRDADWMLASGSSDPYCVCQVIGKNGMSRALQTKTISDNLNPVWNHTEMLRNVHPEDTLFFSVFDEDLGKADDLLGTVELHARDVLPHGFIRSVPLLGKGARGELQLSIDVFEDDTRQLMLLCKTNEKKWSTG